MIVYGYFTYIDKYKNAWFKADKDIDHYNTKKLIGNEYKIRIKKNEINDLIKNFQQRYCILHIEKKNSNYKGKITSYYKLKYIKLMNDNI